MKNSNINNIIHSNSSSSSISKSKFPLLNTETPSSATFSESQTVEPIVFEGDVLDETVIYGVGIGTLPNSFKQFCEDVGLDKALIITAIYGVGIGTLPNSFKQFCEDVGLDKALIIKHLLSKAYQKILQDLEEDQTGIEKGARDILRIQYTLGKISFDNLKKAKDHGWLKDSDIESIKESKKRFDQLLNKSE